MDWCLICSIWSRFGLLGLKKLRRLANALVFGGVSTPFSRPSLFQSRSE